MSFQKAYSSINIHDTECIPFHTFSFIDFFDIEINMYFFLLMHFLLILY
jgi:hypothetical protein